MAWIFMALNRCIKGLHSLFYINMVETDSCVKVDEMDFIPRYICIYSFIWSNGATAYIYYNPAWAFIWNIL